MKVYTFEVNVAVLDDASGPDIEDKLDAAVHDVFGENALIEVHEKSTVPKQEEPELQWNFQTPAIVINECNKPYRYDDYVGECLKNLNGPQIQITHKESTCSKSGIPYGLAWDSWFPGTHGERFDNTDCKVVSTQEETASTAGSKSR